MNSLPESESPWACSVVLADGDAAFIRPLTTNDQETLAEFHRSQSVESIYRRFFSPRPELTEKELEHFTNVDMINRVALAVVWHDEMIAWASYERWPGRDEAEAAFMVDDAHQSKGIATLLLEHLAAIARSNGVERFTAEVLGDNRAMLAVFAKAGWPLQRRFDSGVVDLDWDLATTDKFLDSVERREQRADSRAVARILRPRAVAVVGASDRKGTPGNAVWQNIVGSVDVPVYPVNPGHGEIGGKPCFSSVEELPDDVSLAIIIVPAAALLATVDACIAKRMRGAVIVTSVDGSDIDIVDLVTRARRNGLRLIGPSSMGIASPRPESQLQAALVDVALPAGHVAISMQSGSLGGALLRKAADLDLGLSWFISLGDKSDISANDLLQYWENDDNTRVVALYTESFGNPRKFARIARRVSRTRPIVAVRTGAAAAGDLGGALYQQAGLIEVPTVADLLDTARVLATQPVLKGRRVAVVSNSRSPSVLANAALSVAGLKPAVGPLLLDWSAQPSDYPPAIQAALADDQIDGVIVIYAPPVPDQVSAPAQLINDGIADNSKPVLTVLLGEKDGPLVPGSSLPTFSFPEQAAAVLGRSFAYGRWLENEAVAEKGPIRAVDPAAAHAIIERVINDRNKRIDLASSRALLATYGIEMAIAVEADPSSAVRAATELGYPVAVKAVRRRAGRSARAGVALDLSTSHDVDEALSTMRESLGPDANDLIVQTMTTPGVDVRIHCEHDDQLGALVSVSIGGWQAEAIEDRSSRLAPLSPASATTMLAETRLATALADAGFDPSPLVDVIVQAAQLASDHPEIAELDLNPVIVSTSSVVVSDARIQIAENSPDGAPLRRLE